MGDHDRSREFNRRKKFPPFRDRDHDRGDRGPRDRGNRADRERGDRADRDQKFMKTPIILTKPKPDDKNEVQHKILTKPRDGEAASSGTSSPRPKEEPSAPAPTVPKQHDPPDLSNLWVGFPPMKQPVKFLDSTSHLIKDGLLEYLTEQPDFMVIGVFGYQGVGKSTLLSHLAFPDQSNSVFKITPLEHLKRGSHCTDGIDAYVTSERVIFLDCEAYQSTSIFNKYALREETSRREGIRRESGPDDSATVVLENDVEGYSMQYLSFLMSVCHVLLVVQDWALDIDLVRFIQTAEMLKPHLKIGIDDDHSEYFPHVVFVHTKSKSSCFIRRTFTTIQDTYKKLFKRSHLILQSGIGIADGNVLATLTPELCNGDAINLFFLPSCKVKKGCHDKSSSIEYRGHPGYSELLKRLRAQLYGLPRLPLTLAPLTEKTWFHYSMRVWDNIRKCPYIHEFSRVLPVCTMKDPDRSSSNAGASNSQETNSKQPVTVKLELL